MSGCQFLSWLGVTPLEAPCAGLLTAFPAWAVETSTVSWSLCQEHYSSLTTCWGCGRLSALAPGNLHGACLHCVSAAQWGTDRLWYVTWKPKNR
jgi:hypothetical protein